MIGTGRLSRRVTGVTSVKPGLCLRVLIFNIVLFSLFLRSVRDVLMSVEPMAGSFRRLHGLVFETVSVAPSCSADYEPRCGGISSSGWEY